MLDDALHAVFGVVGVGVVAAVVALADAGAVAYRIVLEGGAYGLGFVAVVIVAEYVGEPAAIGVGVALLAEEVLGVAGEDLGAVV